MTLRRLGSLRYLGCVLLMVQCYVGHSAELPHSPLQPHIVGDWWQIAGDPDLGELTTANQQPVDFGIWQAANGSWQLWSCIRATKEPGNTRLFYRWESPNLTGSDWRPIGIAMHADPKSGERAGGLQAPFVFRDGERFVMFYGGWDYICSAASGDGKHFERLLDDKGKATLFGETSGNTRDPMLIRIGDQWHCYYTAHPQNLGADYCRTSRDLRHWSEAHVVAKGGRAGSGPYSAECPFVIQTEPGNFYLFRTQRYGKDAQTSVYFSHDPLDFGVDNDSGHFVCTLPVAAPEVVRVNDQWFMAALLPSLKGIQIALLAWEAKEASPPVIPVGLDAYRQWDRWPYQRIGARAYMRSTYDRRGGNEGADASHFLYQLADDNNVTLDVAGPGVLYFARYNHWHGSPWRYVVDGTEHIVQETSTADPNHPVPNSVFLPEKAFPTPLTWTWSATKGADLMWVPIPFERSFRMGYSRTRYGTGYYIYHQYVRGANLSQPLRAWDGQTPPSAEVLNLIGRAGSNIDLEGAVHTNGTITALASKETKLLLNLENGPSSIRRLSFSVPRDQALAFGRARLRVTWDDRKEPSIEAPVALFFGAGTLYNREGREYLVKAFPSYIRFLEKRVELACFFPMPYFKSARFELIGPAEESVQDVSWSVRYEPFQDPPNQVGYFHATYRDHLNPEPGKDLVLLDTRETEGGGDWSGNFVGNSWIFSDRANLGTLEGDPRFFFDDSQTPQAYGTGTEEWGGGGDYWGGLNMTLPFAGHPVGAVKPEAAQNDEDKIESAYRFLLADLMPFGRNAVIRLEHGGENRSTEHYQTVTYWYGAPAAALVKTDEFKIGDSASEAAHRYSSPQASEPYSITSRYEWGVDSIKQGNQVSEVYPAQTDSGRKTTGASEFVLKLDPENFGVLLRRKLDYAYPNQRAEVFVADGTGSVLDFDWKPAGIWYLAGGNTCIYSNPKEELGVTQHNVQTSNRRFRDDEFLVPQDLTRGRSSIRVRVKFTPVTVPLFPGQPLPELAWSEIRYDAYCFVMPKWEVGKELR